VKPHGILMKRRRGRIGAELCALAFAGLVMAACSGTPYSAKVTSSTSPKATPPPDATTEYHRLAQNTVESLEAAVSGAMPGSAAARFFTYHLLQLRAYVGLGGFGRALPLLPIKGGFAQCAQQDGHAICFEYQHPRFSTDGRLSSFDVNAVDVGLLVRLAPTRSVSAQRLTLAPGASERVAGLLREPDDSLSVVLRVDNTSNERVSLPDGSAYAYRTDAMATSQPARSYAIPGTISPHSSGLVYLRFSPANFGGGLVVSTADRHQELPIAGPPVVLRNTATRSA
jgi:hypothetical protein